MSDHNIPPRLRGERNAWGFTQKELASLLGYRSTDRLSRVERALKRPGIRIVVGSHILFGWSIEHLFKNLYDAIEEHVVREAYLLHERLKADDRPKAKRKCELLTRVINAASKRHKKK
jgi:transcriptional regulator with XRE-family HTH domain